MEFSDGPRSPDLYFVLPPLWSFRAPVADARIQALQNALLLHPPSENHKPTILSINPIIWGEPHHVINVGPLLGAHPTIAGRPADLEHATAMAFHSAGWQLQRIEEEFRPDLKSPDSIDIALLGEDNQCLVAVEVIPSRKA